MIGAGDSDERRTHPRTPVFLKVEYPTVGGFFKDYTLNLSQGGVMVRTNRDLDEGAAVELVLSFPGLLQPIQFLGEVRWVRHDAGSTERTVGVSFDVSQGVNGDALADLVARLQAADPALVVPTTMVLVVEDNPHVAHLIRNGLRGYQLRNTEQSAFATLHATDGRQALAMLDQESCDLMIVDVYMPVLDGASLIKVVRKDPRWHGLPIIAVSAGDCEARIAALEAGADFFLDKPFRLSDVLESMRKLLSM